MLVKRVFYTNKRKEGGKKARAWIGYFLFGIIPIYIREYCPGILS